MKFAICQIPLFDRHVVAAMDCTEQEALLKFTDYTRENTGEYVDLELLENAKGWCQVSGGDVYVWAKDSVAVLFHELVHAAFALCRQIALSLDEELIARLVAYMKLHLVDKLYYPETTGTDLEAGKAILKGHSLAEGMATFLGEK